MARVLSLLLADRVARSRATGRHDLIGVLLALHAQLPHDLTCAAYYAVTDVATPADLLIQFLDPTGSPLGGGTVRLPTNDTQAIIQGTGTFCVRLIQQGNYRLQLVYEGHVIAETPLLVTAATAPA